MRRKKLLIIPIAVAAAVVLATPTSGPPETRVDTDRHLAVQTWGVPCRGEKIEIVTRRLPDDLNGHAVWYYPYGGRNRPETFYNCYIELDRSVTGTLKLCGVIVHEYGHLRGKHHSRDRYSVMFPRYVRDWPPCVRKFPYAPRTR